MKHVQLAGFALALCLGASGCAGNDSAGPPDFTLAGTWQQSGNFQDVAHNQSHIHLGTFRLSQAGPDFSGTGQQSGFCNAVQGQYTGPLADPAPFQVSAGVLSGMNVSFNTNVCHYQGHFMNGDPNTLLGQATCTYTFQGTSYTFAGSWGMTRQ